jgi:hypothetical protein
MLPVVFTIELSVELSWVSLRPVHGGGGSTNAVDAVPQESRPTQYNITTTHARAGGFGGFFLNSLN